MKLKDFTVTVYYDYLCPWCYLGQIAAKRLQYEYCAQIDWRPLLIHPEIPPEGMRMTPEEKASKADMYERVSRMAKVNGLPITFPEHMVYTKLALEATEYAREQGRLLPFNEAVFKKLFGEGKDIGNWDVLSSAAEEAGLNGEEMRRMTESGRYAAAIDKYTLEAQQRDIDSLPTYILNDAYAVVGPQPFEVFQLVIEKLVQ
ncbi:MAG: hypothetical protein E7234_05575 [Lachnospiraceae bacterium]|nr:hypothetical protein [Lachnospiraceae bacterium]